MPNRQWSRANVRQILTNPLYIGMQRLGDEGIARWVNTSGVGIAIEMFLTAEPANAQRAFQADVVSRVMAHAKIAAIGRATADRLGEFGILPDLAQ